MMEAKSQYQYVVDEYIKRSKMREAGDVLKKMADIDPADLKIRSKLADLYTREGNSGKAVEEHVAIAEELNKKGHLAEALQVLEKGLKIDAKSGRLRLELGRIHLVQKNYDKAVHYLEEAVQGTPNDPRHHGPPGRGLPRRASGSRRRRPSSSACSRSTPATRTRACRWRRVSLQQGQFDRAYGEMEPLVEKLVQRRDGDRAAVAPAADRAEEPVPREDAQPPGRGLPAVPEGIEPPRHLLAAHRGLHQPGPAGGGGLRAGAPRRSASPRTRSTRPSCSSCAASWAAPPPARPRPPRPPS